MKANLEIWGVELVCKGSYVTRCTLRSIANGDGVQVLVCMIAKTSIPDVLFSNVHLKCITST